jgi:hypothetical protein
MCGAAAVTGLLVGWSVLPVGPANAAPSKAASSSPLATQLAVLQSPVAGGVHGRFGFSVAVSGTTAVVGRPDGAYDEGWAYIYVKGPAGWPTTPTVALHDPAATAGDGFGRSVAVSREMIVVGARGTNAQAGVAYVYLKGAVGWPAMPTATLQDPASNAGDEFGDSVAVSRTTAVIGAPGTNRSAGAGYIYVKGGAGWPTIPTATLQDPAATARDSFGSSIAVWDDTVIVGAPLTNGSAGAAYIFVLGAAGWPTTPTVTLHDPAANTYDARFGCSVAVSGNTAVVGAVGTNEIGGSGYGYGAAWTYPKGAAGWPTRPTANLYPVSQGGFDFGFSVAVSGTTVMVGEPGQFLFPVVWIYLKRGSGWPHRRPPDVVFGRSVAMSGTTAIVGVYDFVRPWQVAAADIYRV